MWLGVSAALNLKQNQECESGSGLVMVTGLGTACWALWRWQRSVQAGKAAHGHGHGCASTGNVCMGAHSTFGVLAGLICTYLEGTAIGKLLRNALETAVQKQARF